MHLRLFRHFIPLSGIILASLDALLISWYIFALGSTGSTAGTLDLTAMVASGTAGFWLIAVFVMLSIGLYGPRNFATFGMLMNRIAVATAIIILFSFVLPPNAQAGTVASHASGYPSQPVL